MQVDIGEFRERYLSALNGKLNPDEIEIAKDALDSIIAELTEGRKATTCKMGLDATIPITHTGKGFEREEYSKVKIRKFL